MSPRTARRAAPRSTHLREVPPPRGWKPYDRTRGPLHVLDGGPLGPRCYYETDLRQAWEGAERTQTPHDTPPGPLLLGYRRTDELRPHPWPGYPDTTVWRWAGGQWSDPGFRVDWREAK